MYEDWIFNETVNSNVLKNVLARERISLYVFSQVCDIPLQVLKDFIYNNGELNDNQVSVISKALNIPKRYVRN